MDIMDAREFWNQQMEKHRMIRGILSVIGSVIGYFIGGHFIVTLGQWLLLFCGRIAETVMLFAVVFLTANFVAHDFLVSHIGDGIVATLLSLAILALSLLPEVTLYSAVIITLTHWQDALADRKSVKHWAWSVIYSVPTLSFFGMTIYTISSMVSEGGHFQQATGVALVLRCLAGWLYGLIELIYAGIGRRHTRQEQSKLPGALLANNALLEALEASNQQFALFAQQTQATIQQLTQQNNDLVQQFSALSQQTTNAQQQSQATIQQITASVQQISKEQATMQQSVAKQAANMALLQQSNEKSTANTDRLAEAVSQVKEELSAPRQQSQQRLFALPARAAKTSKESFVESKEDGNDTDETFAVDAEIMETVVSLASLEALAGIEQSDVYKVLEAYQKGVGRSQIYQHLGWGSGKHTKIVKPVIDAYVLSKEQQAM